LADGGWSETPTVRYYDELGVRRRHSFETMAEADFERARLARDQSRRGPIAGPAESMTLADFWPTYHADACSRLQEATIASYEGVWRRAVEQRLGDRPLHEITPREISMWRVEMQKAGKGPEAIRMSMMLVQAMFTLALEWGEASTNPVALVRRPRQGRQRAIDVMDPKLVECVRRWMLDHGDLFGATLVSVLAYSGMRPGEALAVERRHIRNDTILVEQAIARGRIKLQRRDASTAPSTSCRHRATSSEHGPRPAATTTPPLASSPARTASGSRPTTGTTGATVTSTPPSTLLTSAADVPTTSATPSSR
jgi:hypothetical protein